MSPEQSVGKLNLEGLMSRAEILFTAAYMFEGKLNIEQLKNSFHTITDAISKFKYQIDFKAQNDFQWRRFEDYGERFHVFESNDIQQTLKQVSADSFEIRKRSKNFPLQLAVIQSTVDDRFYVAEMCSHEYIDARSAETLFHLIIDHYNASYFGDTEAANQALATAKQLHTLDAQAMLEILKHDEFDATGNIESLENYAIADDGGYGVRLATLPDLLPRFAKRRRETVSCLVNAKPMIDRCRSAYPEVTKNAIITAVLHKAIYNLNVREKGTSDKQIIAGKTVSDLLTQGLREQYIGNYIAFVPISTPGEIPIEEIAKRVHDRTVEFKTKQINLSCFDLVEQGAEENAVGTEDDELSYVITNWNNYRFLSSRSFLAGCESLALHSSVNVDPLDAGGAALINRAIVVINLNFDDELCFSMFPSLRDDTENRQLVGEVESLFNAA